MGVYFPVMETKKRLDLIFFALSDSRRRDILEQLSDGKKSVSELAESFDMTLSAISKHIKQLQDAELLHKTKQGKQVFCRMNDNIWKEIATYISMYQNFWNSRFQELENFINIKE